MTNVYLMLQRKKCRILTNASIDMPISELRDLIQKMWKENPKEIHLFTEFNVKMKNDEFLQYHINSPQNHLTADNPFIIDVCLTRDYEQNNISSTPRTSMTELRLDGKGKDLALLPIFAERRYRLLLTGKTEWSQMKIIIKNWRSGYFTYF